MRRPPTRLREKPARHMVPAKSQYSRVLKPCVTVTHIRPSQQVCAQVRKRPGMYIGSTGAKGLHHLVFEILDNAIDEVMAGHASCVDVKLLEDGACSVTDDGRGIPCDVHPQTGRSALETVLCVLHAGGKFGGENSGYRVSGGLHGVGLSVVNALSERMDVFVRRDGKDYSMSFSRGKPLSPLVEANEPEMEDGAARTGTRVVFVPDSTIFKDTTVFEFDVLASRMGADSQANLRLPERLSRYCVRR